MGNSCCKNSVCCDVLDVGDIDADSDIYIDFRGQTESSTIPNQNQTENQINRPIDNSQEQEQIYQDLGSLRENNYTSGERERQPRREPQSVRSNYIWSFDTGDEQCIICMDNPIQCAILNCGHLKFCIRCLTAMCENRDPDKEYLNNCPVCRDPIKGFVTFTPNFYYKITN